VGSRSSVIVETGTGAHPASYTMGTRSLSRRVKRPGRGDGHPPQYSAEVREREELHLYSLSEPSWPVPGRTLPFLPVVINTYFNKNKNGDYCRKKSIVFGFRKCDQRHMTDEEVRLRPSIK
jgi:hypothetical protein